MSTASWLLLTDYSSKYRISVSTLRRRIKSEQIQYKFEHGKYLILDAPPGEASESTPRLSAQEDGQSGFQQAQQQPFQVAMSQSTHQPVHQNINQSTNQNTNQTMPLSSQSYSATEPVPLRSPFASTPGLNQQPPEVPLAQEAKAELESHSGEQAEPIISTATKLLNELKRAYMNILQEKESQLIQLKEEVSDLKTLVRVLEDENDRLRSALGMSKVL